MQDYNEKNILIVDDKEENLYLLESILKSNGYKVTTAYNGVEALEYLQSQTPDLIISDILMPKMDGYTLCRECKKRDSLKSIPFIFYTATYTNPDDEEFALSLGADRYLLKPQEPDVLSEIIFDLLKKTDKKFTEQGNVEEKPEDIILKEYNAILIRKLEDKILETKKNESILKSYVEELERTISEREKIEKELIRNKLFLADLIENSGTLIYVKNLIGEYELVNKKWEQVTGINRNFALGKTDEQIFSSVNSIDFIKNDSLVLTEGKVIEKEEVLTSENGQRYFISVKFPIYSDNGAITGLCGMSTEITEQKQNEIRLRALTAKLEKVKEEERIRLSRELHDHLGQNLTGLKMDLAFLLKQKQIQKDEQSNDLPVTVSDIFKSIDDMINTVRKISFELRPNTLDYLGLIPAIELQLDELRTKSSIECEFNSSINKIDFGDQINSSVYRIVQEALTNIIRHSKATSVQIQIDDEKDFIKISIKDNGIGIDSTRFENIKSLGIIGMKERTLQFNGELLIENNIPAGTKVSLYIPKKELI